MNKSLTEEIQMADARKTPPQKKPRVKTMACKQQIFGAIISLENGLFSDSHGRLFTLIFCY